MYTDLSQYWDFDYWEAQRLHAESEYARLLKMAEGNAEQTWALCRELDAEDLYFLLTRTLNREDCRKAWYFARCREVQANPFGYVDVWFREGGKSTVHRALTIQLFIRFPEWTHCILGKKLGIAQDHVTQIMRELETNAKLKNLHPDVFWQDPKKQSPKWSERDGIINIRKGNPPEATLEAHGIIEGLPTGPHFDDLYYDDIMTADEQDSPEMIKKIIERRRMSSNISKEFGSKRYVGTFYNYADPHVDLINSGAAKPRIYSATKTGTVDGAPVLWTREVLAQKIREQGGAGSYTTACQLFCKPTMDEHREFRAEMLRYWPANHYNNMNLYILCDPANEKKTWSDYTVFIVIGLGRDRNYYVIKIIRDKLGLTERANVLFKLHQDYRPRRVGYEKYGMQSDIQHFESRMSRDNYRFSITALHGGLSKNDRIRQLLPVFNDGRMWLPETCIHTNYLGVMENVTQVFVDEEYLPFPFGVHDDIFDCLQRILDPELSAIFPSGDPGETFHDNTKRVQEQPYDPYSALRAG